jgi:hypothetical protein
MENKAMSSSAIATLVKMMESLPETLQDKVVEHLQEYILKSNITVAVNPDGKLEIPAEIEAQLKPGDRYTVTVTADYIVFQKVAGFDWEELRRRRESLPPDPNPMTKVKSGFDWEEWERRVEAANPDPDELTMEEICELVREVRREKRFLPFCNR